MEHSEDGLGGEYNLEFQKKKKRLRSTQEISLMAPQKIGHSTT